MAWYWNEWVYILLWILIIIGILTGAIVASTSEGFQNIQDPLDLALFFQPYQPEDICEIYAFVYPKVVEGEAIDGTNRRSEAEARERATKVLQQAIPGELLKCPIEYPKDKSIDAVFPYMIDLPDTFLATLYATLIFCTTKLQKSLYDVTKALQEAANAQKEGFQNENANICSKEAAEAKRKELAEKEKANCVLPESIPVEQRTQQLLAKMAKLSKGYLDWRNGKIQQVETQINQVKEPYAKAKVASEVLKAKLKEKNPDEISDDDRNEQSNLAEQVSTYEAVLLELNYTKFNLTQTIPALVNSSKEMMPKLVKLQKNLESGNYSVPAEGFENFFQSPLH
jgi:hypothetical protein